MRYPGKPPNMAVELTAKTLAFWPQLTASVRHQQEERNSMSTPAKTPWRIAGEEVNSCNCAWGCPCQFNALPTHGRCEALIGFQIQEGYFGATRLDGVRFVRIHWWPGPVHEGNGIRQTIIDTQATPD